MISLVLASALLLLSFQSAAEGPKPVGSFAPYFGRENYPLEAMRERAEGRVVAILSVNPDGKVSGCHIDQSSGNPALDQGTCDRGRRIRFTPARDTRGAAVSGIYPLDVVWSLNR